MRRFLRLDTWQGLRFTIPVTIGTILGSGGERWILEKIRHPTEGPEIISNSPKD
jgi:hypothetical protein